MTQIGVIFLNGLLGDTIQAHLAWGKRYDKKFIAAVPENGPTTYLGEICEMSPWVDKTFHMPLTSNKLESQFRQCAEFLSNQDVSELFVWDSEDFRLKDMLSEVKHLFSNVSFLTLVEHGLTAGVPRHWQIPSDILDWRNEFLQKNGIQSYITVHNREKGWAANLNVPKSRDWVNDVRNYDIDPLIRACQKVLPENFKVIRVGDRFMKKCHNPGVIDVTDMQLSLKKQFALHHGALFFIGCNSGVGNIVHALHKPILYINTTQPFTSLRFKHLPTINISKRVFVKGKTVPLDDINLYHGGQGPGRLLDGIGYEIRENPESELIRAIQKMFELINRKQDLDLYLLPDGSWLDETAYISQMLGIKLPKKSLTLGPTLMKIQEEKSRFFPRDFRKVKIRPFKLGLFGLGKMGKKLMNFFHRNRGDWIFELYDNDSSKWGGIVDGHEILPPNKLIPNSLDLVIIATNTDQGNLRQALISEGWIAERVLYFDEIKDPERGFIVEVHCLKPQKNSKEDAFPY